MLVILGQQVGLCTLGSVDKNTGHGEVSHGPVLPAEIGCPAWPERTTVDNELTWHQQRGPPQPCQTFPKSGVPL